MNLEEHIRRILQEETKMLRNLLQLRRRRYLIDDAIQKVFKHSDISGAGFLYNLIHGVQVWIHTQYFVYSEIPDEEWEEIKEFIKDYIIIYLTYLRKKVQLMV